MRMTINKLIANDIINYGMENTNSFNYVVDTDTYLSDYDEVSKKYILDNLDEITQDIESNECVADLTVSKDNGNTNLDMVFYTDYLLNSTEKIVSDNANLFKIDLELEDIKEITERIIDVDEFNDELIRYLKSYDKGNEL